MNYDEILKVLAPCGLNCLKCMAYKDGGIARNAAELKRNLGSFERYAERFSAFMPGFADYPMFKSVLDIFAGGECLGCRSGTCLYPNCGVKDCYKTKGVNFCFECASFPCNMSNFDTDLERRWVIIGTRIKIYGLERYYRETKDLPRY